MYNHYNDFKGEVSKIWSVVLSFRPHWYKLFNDFESVETKDAWEMYCNTKTSTLSELLLGDLSLRSDRPVLANFGTTSGTQSTIEKGTNFDTKKKVVKIGEVVKSVSQHLGSSYRKTHGIEHMRKGSVLNDGFWWPFKNDAWVVGGVHGLKFFHLALESVPDDLLWDSSSKRPRVLGRELIGIHYGGYKRVAHMKAKSKEDSTLIEDVSMRKLGMVFAPQKKSTAEGATFPGYYEELKKYKSLQSIKDLAFNDPVSYDDYDFASVKG